jgi:hypothetical protein
MIVRSSIAAAAVIAASEIRKLVRPRLGATA